MYSYCIEGIPYMRSASALGKSMTGLYTRTMKDDEILVSRSI